MNDELQFPEFEDFFQAIGFKINENEFQTEILNKYCSSVEGLTLQGFKDLMLTSLHQ
jgi:hypothetical protein